MQIQHYSEEEAVFQLASSIIKVSLLTDVGGGGGGGGGSGCSKPIALPP